MAGFKLPGTDTEVPWWMVGAAALAGLVAILWPKLSGQSVNNAASPDTTTSTGTTTGIDAALQFQNFDELRQALIDYINSYMEQNGGGTQTAPGGTFNTIGNGSEDPFQPGYTNPAPTLPGLPPPAPPPPYTEPVIPPVTPPPGNPTNPAPPIGDIPGAPAMPSSTNSQPIALQSPVMFIGNGPVGGHEMLNTFVIRKMGSPGSNPPAILNQHVLGYPQTLGSLITPPTLTGPVKAVNLAALPNNMVIKPSVRGLHK